MKRIKKVLAIAAIVMLMAGVAGCARLQSGIHDLHGSIVGNEYNIDIFDNIGVRTLRSHGKKIDIDNNIVEERSYASATDEWYSTKTLSSVITITIDGKQLISCGDTCVFYDKRLTPEYEFYLDDIDSNSSGILDSTLISGRVNSIKNEFGKPMVVVIKSQMGAPIYAFSGDKVYWEIEDDLPRFTKLMIDGKALYIHRANFQIVDKALLD
jgi:hypothetical protein